MPHKSCNFLNNIIKIHHVICHFIHLIKIYKKYLKHNFYVFHVAASSGRRKPDKWRSIFKCNFNFFSNEISGGVVGNVPFLPHATFPIFSLRWNSQESGPCPCLNSWKIQSLLTLYIKDKRLSDIKK